VAVSVISPGVLGGFNGTLRRGLPVGDPPAVSSSNQSVSLASAFFAMSLGPSSPFRG
jgi:hypothetical protein